MDEVRRQLQLIDSQFRGQWDILRELLHTAPLTIVAIGLISGILIQYYLALSIWLWLFSAIGIFLIAGFSLIKYRDTKWLSLLMAAGALLCTVSLGGARLARFDHYESNDIRNFVDAERVLATIRGVIKTEPYTNHNEQWAFAKFTHTDPKSSFYLELTEAYMQTGWAKVSGTVRVQVYEPVLDLKAGDHIEAYCWLDRFRPATNPGSFDFKEYLARRNVHVGATIKMRDSIKVLEKNSGFSFSNIKRAVN